ncbi:hypothetical protein Q73A0000_12465 [Kaistella flava (ex Peng et al. 2021)]|uniref:Uncharacterized protein n=1 Tax=Kaistella flava (ex Peng et al. 2021) TaxID=2038776 RepID=A0A7M2YCK3_9FLAO|nr:hypothetical protein [Kaistella flava (ex Peng et al. 2021)]QOW11113.1 hypothetical protein Q73A0000_12465 [Kaistella flava (ex Peng et al. 2021)]
MQSLQDIHDKIFFETKSILETLCKIHSKDELLAKQDLFTELTDRIAFLRILEKNEDSFNEILDGKSADNQFNNDNKIIDEATEHVEFNETDFSDDFMEEEVMFTNELNDFEDEIEIEDKTFSHPLHDESIEDPNEEIEIDSISEADLSEDYEIPLIVEQEEPNYAERVAQKERDFEEMEERRRTIVEFTKHETVVEDEKDSTENKTETPQQQAEKKFKLANIKGIKVVQQLFDLDTLEEDEPIKEPQTDQGSLLNTNVKTDFMQAERKKPEFRLDLNDKVAFAKSLFAGNEEELKATIEKLNSFSTLEEAKQYLSEIYYKKDWSKVDEYAQRLWNLVENKFM